MEALGKDLVCIVRFGRLELGKQPVHFLAKAKAALNKTTRLWKAESKDFFSKWLEKALDNNGRLAHKWANVHNVPPAWVDLALGPESSTHPLDHLAVQEDKFAELWLAEEPDTQACADLFQQVRQRAMQRRSSGEEPLGELLDLFQPACIRKVVTEWCQAFANNDCRQLHGRDATYREI